MIMNMDLIDLTRIIFVGSFIGSLIWVQLNKCDNVA